MGADLRPLQLSQITGGNEAEIAGVELIGGKPRLLTDAQITVSVTQGKDPIPDTFVTITNAGAIGDTYKIDVQGTANDPSTPDDDVPLCTVTSTVTASEAGDEIALRDLLVADFNANSNCRDNAFLKAVAVKDRPIVQYTSTVFSLTGEFFERTNAGDVALQLTGSVAATLDSDRLISRGKNVSLARDPSNPHSLGILGIAGTVTSVPGSIGDREFELAKNASSVSSLLQDCDPFVAATCDFFVNAVADKRFQVEQIRCFGGGNGIKYGQLLSKNVVLVNGIQIRIRSGGAEFDFEPIKVTEHFKNLFASDAPQFRVDVQSGADQFIAIFKPTVPFPIEAVGTVTGGDDFIRVRIDDDISSGIAALQCAALGFLEDI